MRNKQSPELLDSTEAAEFLGLAGPSTLAVWRCRKRYPLPYIRVGKKILYDVDDLLAFLKSRKVHQVEVDR